MRLYNANGFTNVLLTMKCQPVQSCPTHNLDWIQTVKNLGLKENFTPNAFYTVYGHPLMLNFLVLSQISLQLLPWHLIQTFAFPWGWTIITLMIPWLFMKAHDQVKKLLFHYFDQIPVKLITLPLASAQHQHVRTVIVSILACWSWLTAPLLFSATSQSREQGSRLLLWFLDNWKNIDDMTSHSWYSLYKMYFEEGACDVSFHLNTASNSDM